MRSGALKKILESIPDPFYVIDARNYSIKMANHATAVFGDISRHTTCYELTHKRKQPCQSKKHLCPLRLVKKTRKPVTTEHIHYDDVGKVRYMELHCYPVFDDNGKIVEMAVFSLDITEHKKIQQALQEAKNALEANVDAKTDELTNVNKALRLEISEHKKAEKKLWKYHQKLRSMSSKLTLAEERQRKQIASDLHDVVIQTLVMSSIKLAEIRQSLSDAGFVEQLDEINSLVDQAINDSRALIFQISPPILHILGFLPAVEWLTEQFQEQHGIRTSFQDDGESKRLDKDIQILLYRAVRELLINIAKHANAKEAAISLQESQNKIKITVSDDGAGFEVFDTDLHLEKANGFGLFSIRERLDDFGGDLDIKSVPGQGTWITLTAPLICSNTDDAQES